MWVVLDEESGEVADYLNGEFIPLKARETEHGIEVWMPHEWNTGGNGTAVICSRCGLMPLEYDGVTTDCVEEE